MSGKVKKALAIVVCIIMFAAMSYQSTYALSANEYGLGISAQQNEKEITVTLENANSFDVNNVSVKCLLPDELTAIGSTSKDFDVFKTGEIINLSFSADTAAKPAAAPVESPVAEKDGTTVNLLVLAAVAALTIALLILITRKTAHGKKMLSILLAVFLLLPCLNMISFHAFGVDEKRSFTLNDTITIENKEYPLTVTVEYSASTAENSYFELKTDSSVASNTKVTRSTVSADGVAVADSSVKSVTYEIRSAADNYEVSAQGEAKLDGCEWSIDDCHLKPGDNEIVVTAVLDDGTVQTEKYNQVYDSGELYRYTVNEIKETNDTTYVDKVINVFFKNDVSDERADKIIAEMGGTRVGESYGSGLVQAKVQVSGIDNLNDLCKEFEEYDEVNLAGVEQVLDICSNVVENAIMTNDPWFNDGTKYTETWNEELPGGYNWSIECVRAPSAWEYDEYYNNVIIGVIDGGFKTDHEDYDDLVHFTSTDYEADNDPTDNHGTHVSGIIGATSNNGKGISGLLWDVDIYGANFYSDNSVAYIVSAVTAEVEAGARAVNLSLGLNNKYNASTAPNPYLDPYTPSQLASMAGQCAAGMSNLICTGYEFVVVQSAGNGVVDSRLSTTTYRSVDAKQNGLFCSINKQRYGALTAAQATEVYDRIIVAGAIQNTSSEDLGADFTMWYRGNGGTRVDVYAPGVSVYSTITPTNQGGTIYNYAAMTGTSQAAPIVTAIAGLCFAIKPDLTGAEVKNIICDPANCEYVAFDNDQTYTAGDGTVYDLHPFTTDGKVVSMLRCAEATLRLTCDKADYTSLNNAVASANSLDPTAYANYDTVFPTIQAVIDSINYDMYSFEQKKVDAKRMELLNAMNQLIDRVAANYEAVDTAITRANALNQANYTDFSAVTASINAVVRGKSADEQTAVDTMASNINAAIDQLEPIVQVESTHVSVIPDHKSQIIVTTEDHIDYLASSLTPNGNLTLSAVPNASGTYSTGSTVILTKKPIDSSYTTNEEDISAVYTVVVIGDIDGSASVDGQDAFTVRMYAAGLLPMPTGAEFVAADADCNGVIDNNDAVLIENTALDNDQIVNEYIPD